jgi:hypothetical protein
MVERDDLLTGGEQDAGGAPSGAARGRGAVPRRPRPRLGRLRRTPWAMVAVGVALVCLGVATVPALVLAVAAAVLGAALLWKSRAPRSAGTAVVPAAAVWGAGAASLLSLAALSLHVIVGHGPQATADAPRQDSAPPAAPSSAVPAVRSSSATPVPSASTAAAAPSAAPGAAASRDSAGMPQPAQPAAPASPPHGNPEQQAPVPAPPAPAPSSASTQPAPAPAPPSQARPAPSAPAPSPTSGGSQTRPAPAPSTCSPDQTSGLPTVQIGVLGIGATVSGTGDGGSCN